MANENQQITVKQYWDLHHAITWEEDRFPEMLENYTGLIAKKVTMLQIFDSCGDYIGNTYNDSIGDLMRKAYIEVIEDGK